MIEISTKSIHIVCYYAPEDETLLHELNMHLSVLKRQGLIATWSNHSIEVEEVTKTDSTHIEMDIVFLLISQKFLASAFCSGLEIKNLLRLHKEGRIRVIPIILEPAPWKDSPFNILEELPVGGKAISSWSNLDEGFYVVAKAVHHIIQNHINNKQLRSERDALVSNNKDEKAQPSKTEERNKAGNALNKPKQDRQPLIKSEPPQYYVHEKLLKEYLLSLRSFYSLSHESKLTRNVLSFRKNDRDNVHTLSNFFANDLTKQSYLDQACAKHLTMHQLSQRDAWETMKPTLLDISRNPLKLEWPILFMFSLDEQLSLAQEWIQPLVWSLTQESRIKQNFAQTLLRGSGSKNWITHYIQSLVEESKLEKSCAMELKLNLAVQKEATQKWLLLLKRGRQEDYYSNIARLSFLLQQFDEHIRSEQKAMAILEQGLDLQTKNEQLWIAIAIQYLGKPDQFKQILSKMPFQFSTEQDWVKTVLQIEREQKRAEEAWVNRFLKHTADDHKVEHQIKEMISPSINEKVKTQPLPKTQSWQDFIQTIEETLEKHAQVKLEATEKLAANLEKRSQTKKEAADLLAIA